MKKTVIWEIRPPEQENTVSFVFGTFHVRDARAFGWLRFAWPLIDQCRLVATEFDLAEIDPVALAAASRLPEDQGLDTLLRPAAWKQLVKYCRKHLGMHPDDLRSIQPMILQNYLSISQTDQDAELAIDEQIYQYAVSRGMEIAGVESFKDQMAVLQQIPLKTQLKQLKQLVKHFSRHGKLLRKMMQWYAAGDIQQLYKSARKDSKGMRKVLIHDRNRHMANRIATLTTEHNCFIAIGAGHLAGEKGVLRLLKKKGFKVKAVLPASTDI